MTHFSPRWLACLALIVTSACAVKGDGLVAPVMQDGGSSAPAERPTVTDGATTAADAPAPTDEREPVRLDAPPAPTIPAPDARVDPSTPASDAAPPRADARPDLSLPPDLRSPRAVLMTSDVPTTAGDLALVARLQQLGFRVMIAVARDAAGSRMARDLALAADLLVITSSYDTVAGAPAGFAELPVPILCSEDAFLDDLHMIALRADAHGVLDAGTRIAFTNLQHPLRAGIMPASVAVTSAPRPFTWGRALPSAAVIATLNGVPEGAAIFAYGRGDALSQGQAPARRVGWYATAEAIPVLTDAGWSLFDAAVRWAVGR